MQSSSGVEFRGFYEGDRRTQGRVSELEIDEWVWWAWRPTGKTLSGVEDSRTGAEEQVAAAMEQLAVRPRTSSS